MRYGLLLCKILATLFAVAVGVSFLYFAFYIFNHSILPAIQSGTLNIHSNIRVLDIFWQGNQVYLIWFAYLSISLVALLALLGIWRSKY
ncbi:hypothetical protein [Thalassotalea agarivorans]|nr:hypothetical protein [Thalassotalea agarivorans]